MNEYEIITKTKSTKYIFLTKAQHGKAALRNLMTHSNDFKCILGLMESNTMTIKIKKLNTHKASNTH